MIITNLDLSLGNDRTLNSSDLAWLLGKSDVLCFQNGPVSPVEGWELLEVGFSGLLYQSGSDAIVEGPSVMLDGVLIVVVEADTLIESIAGRSNVHDGPVILTGDFSTLSDDAATSVVNETGMSFYKDSGAGFFVNDPHIVQSFTRIGITHGTRSVNSLVISS